MQLKDIVTNARVELLEPMNQRPSRRYLLQLATTNLQSFFNEIQGTGRPWAVCDQPLTLTVQSGKGEYTLPVSDNFGRVLDVTTFDPGNASFIERQVEFTELADQKFDWALPRNHQSSGGVERMSFFRKGYQSNVYVSVWPIPQGVSRYHILYSLGNYASEMALDDSPLLAQHHGLLVVKSALDALPASAWWKDEKENRIRRNELRESLSGRLPMLMDHFRKHVRNVTQPRMTQRLVYSIDD